MGGGGQNLIDSGVRGVQDLTLSGIQNLPEGVKSPLRQVVGRVATNVIDPAGYYQNESGNLSALLNAQNLGSTLKSIIKDEPAIGQFSDKSRAARPLFRAYFDLPTQDAGNVYLQSGKDFRINPDTSNREAQAQSKLYAETALGKQGSGWIGGNFIGGQPDPWNFDLHPDELKKLEGKHLPMEAFGRMLLESIGRPAVLQTGGYSNPAPNEDLLPGLMRLLGQ